MYQTKSVEKVKTLIVMFSTIFPENHAICEIMWKNAVKPERLYMKIYYGACSLRAGYPRFRHKLKICNIYCFSTAAVITRMYLNVTFIRTVPVLFCFHPLHGRKCSRHSSHGKIEIISGNFRFL